MPILRRRSAAFVAMAAAVLVPALLAACGTDAAPSSADPAASQPSSQATGASTPPIVPPSLDAAGVAYSRAMCPIFTSILELDPDLAALRAIGASGGDLDGAVADMQSASDGLLPILTSLEEVPTWGPGAEFRFHLITALHAIRTQLLGLIAEPGGRAAADGLAELPLIASEAVDRSFREAVAAGFSCDSGA